MGKHNSSFQAHHVYLGVGGMLAVAALVLALTFGLSSATMMGGDPSADCVSHGGTWTGSTCNMPTQVTCWDGSTRATIGECPAQQCPAGQTGTPPNCTTPVTTVSCPNGTQVSDYSQCPKCSDGVTVMPAPPATCPETQQTTCPAGQTGTPPNCTTSGTQPVQTVGSCTSGQWWDAASSTCKSSTNTQTMDAAQMQAGCVAAGGTWKLADAMHTQPWCDMGHAGTAGGCPTGQWWNGTACTSSTTTPVQTVGSCTSGQWWDAASSTCKSSGQTMDAAQMQAGCVSAGGTWQGVTATPPCKMPGDTNMMNNTGTMPPCGPNVFPTPQNPCRMEGGTRGASEEGMMFNQTFTDGCSEQMLKCDDQYSPRGFNCFSKQLWDYKTQAMKEATCDDYKPQGNMGGPGMGGFGPGMGTGFGPGMGGFGHEMGGPDGKMPPRMPFFGQGKDGGEEVNFGDYCAQNPWDMSCKAGLDLNAMRDQYKQQFEFDPETMTQTQVKKNEVKMRLNEIKRELSGINRDVKEVSGQLDEATRAAGSVCPVTAQVQGGLDVLKQFVEKAKSLTKNSTVEDVQSALSLLEQVRGKVRPTLFGNEKGPGVMSKLHQCSDVTFVKQDACRRAEEVSGMLEDFGEKMLAEDRAKVEGGLTSLKQLCNDPFNWYTSQGGSLDDLFSWEPPEECRGGPFPGPGGPFPMGEDMFNNMPPEMMERMKQEFEKYQKGEFQGGFGGGNSSGFGGSPFGTSVLTAQSSDDFDFEDFEDEDFDPSNCAPPLQKAVMKVMRPLEELMMASMQRADGENVCDMIATAKKHLDREIKRSGEFGPPQEIQDLVAEGVAACTAGDYETAEAVKEQMFAFAGDAGKGPRGRGRRGGRDGGLKNVLGVDSDKLFEDKVNAEVERLLNEKLGDEEDKEDKIAELTKQLETLSKALDETTKALIATRESYNDLVTKLGTSGIETSKELGAAITTAVEHPNAEVSDGIAENLSEVVALVEDIKDAYPDAPKLDLLDNVVKNLAASPPTDAVLTDIKAELSEYGTYLGSSPTEAKAEDKLEDAVASIAVLNAADINNKLADGTCASADTCDYTKWNTKYALAAEAKGFADANAVNLYPAGANTVEMVVTQLAGLAAGAGVIQAVDKPENEADYKSQTHTGVPGDVSWWAGAAWDAVEEKTPVLDTLDPNNVVQRDQYAVMAAELLKLPVPEDYKSVLPVDVQNHTDARLLAAVVDAGCMSTTDGTHFNPDATFTRDQSWVVLNCLSKYLGGGEDARSAADEDDSFDFEDEE